MPSIILLIQSRVLDPAAFEQWLYKVFQEKDKLMAQFFKNGAFKGSKSRKIPVASSFAIFWITLATAVSTLLLWALIVGLAARIKYN